MMLEILHTNLLYLFLVLIVSSYATTEQALADNGTCASSCRVNSTIICLQFDANKTDLDGAKHRCKTIYKRALLTKDTYNGNPTCFKKYLQSLGTSTHSAWLDAKRLNVPDDDSAEAFNITGPFSTIRENNHHSMICTSQGSAESLSRGSNNSTVVTNHIESNTPGHSANNTSTSGSGESDIKDNSDNNKDNQADNSKTSKDDHWDVAIPVALATAALVMSICCITCVVCGIILFRKREKIITTIRTINTPVDSTASALDSVELKSTVNVYANIKQQKRNCEKQQRESRFLNDSEIVNVDDDKEIYSTVNTQNTYSNMDSALHDHNPGELYSCCDGSSTICRQYDNMATASLQPPSYSLCVAGSDTEKQKDSGRYTSDGLLYVTLNHDARERKARPVKAKSEEHVEYLRIDFDKTAKMYKKKHRSLSRGKNRDFLGII